MGEIAPVKPPYGAPCNGCDLCCIAEPCPIAVEVLGAIQGRCPALEYEHGRYWCGLLRSAHRHIDGMQNKPWIDDVMQHFLLATGGWRGPCDSHDDPAPEVAP